MIAVICSSQTTSSAEQSRPSSLQCGPLNLEPEPLTSLDPQVCNVDYSISADVGSGVWDLGSPVAGMITGIL